MSKVAEFYDAFNSRLVRDFLYGNPRVSSQRKFFLKLIKDERIKSVLVVGCGIGDVSSDLAKVLERRSGHVLAVDISGENVATARKLFQRENLRFECVDIVKQPPLEQVWDLIVFPDVYEHIPVSDRSKLHASLSRMLAENGSVALTCPSVQQQRALRASGEGLQVVDEDVCAADVLSLADDLNAYLVHFTYLTVFLRNDYFHALMSRIPDTADLGDYAPQPNYLYGLFLWFFIRLRAWCRRRFINARSAGKTNK